MLNWKNDREYHTLCKGFFLENSSNQFIPSRLEQIFIQLFKINVNIPVCIIIYVWYVTTTFDFFSICFSAIIKPGLNKLSPVSVEQNRLTLVLATCPVSAINEAEGNWYSLSDRRERQMSPRVLSIVYTIMSKQHRR